MEPSRGQQSAVAREGAGADRGHREPGLPWAQPTIRTTSARGSRGPPMGVRSWGSEFTWLMVMPQDQGEQSGRKGSRLRAAMCSGEVGTAGGELGRSLLSRPMLPHLSLGGVSGVFLWEKDRTVSRHPACSSRGHVLFCIMPCHPPLSTEGVEGTRRMLTTGRTREASDGPRRPLPDLPATGLRATPTQDAPSAPPASLGVRLHEAAPPTSGCLCITTAWMLCLSLSLHFLPRQSAVPSLGPHLW